MEALKNWYDCGSLSNSPIWFLCTSEFIMVQTSCARESTGVQIEEGSVSPLVRASLWRKSTEVSNRSAVIKWSKVMH